MKATHAVPSATVIFKVIPEVSAELRSLDGSSVQLSVNGDEISIRRDRRGVYSLAELLKSSDPRAFERSVEDEEWFNSPPVGRELI